MIEGLNVSENIETFTIAAKVETLVVRMLLRKQNEPALNKMSVLEGIETEMMIDVTQGMMIPADRQKRSPLA
ncbi:MAG: hypothetical protein DCF19_13950 [Pseudanabaena frigida]|uniref:Uncharacterized protein n=1 Tax=Pseudanabaena frigida TaxID=945775 RepID=A0A2W4W7V0_9CYAN|nr:MAG: hypothetical protein DCF19_13950 [Pseudanabaena frigida]